jgi:hypothetical protein
VRIWTTAQLADEYGWSQSEYRTALDFAATANLPRAGNAYVFDESALRAFSRWCQQTQVLSPNPLDELDDDEDDDEDDEED